MCEPVSRLQSDVPILVVAAVIDKGGQYLICQRPPNKHHANLWEFPGGKVDSGETCIEALERELHEELNLNLVSAKFLHQEHGTANTQPLKILFYDAEITGEPKLLEHQALSWQTPKELFCVSLAPADQAFVRNYLAPTQLQH